ncbi:response regulator transcription factor [Umezawaea tangerina]|uniref:DNA-binding NarL/FixJ family response regulator n=1 Tax=Umezawaea tangerina TaxID=84725 RepID=A0A2T0T074_9PSEU|nr:response regulator transcription factor [Umezawaea tangerina]PRY39078.1 DNA-binding NarL/FixJ family response regulator [Umezawaea tangerina]
MGERVRVHVEATDSVTRFGVIAQLGQSPELEVVPRSAVGQGTVVVLAADAVTDEVLVQARELGRTGCTHFILLTSSLDDAELRAAVKLGVCGVLERRDTTPAKLARMVLRATQGEAALPAAMLNRLFQQVATLEVGAVAPYRPAFTGLTARESQVLRLIAEGLDTDEIATKLAYSSRTVKNIVHAVTTRFCLRNRSHAVAYAMREGLI